MKVLIAGAGIGGLTAALALHAKGIEVELLEAAPHLGEVGAGLQLGANATRVLQALGVGDAVQQIAFVPQAMQLRDYRSGRVLTDMMFGDAYQARYGAPYWQVHRADLHNALAAAVQARMGDVIRLGCDVQRYEQDDAGVQVTLANGDAAHADVLVGADGIRSQVRQQMLGDGAPRFTGHVAWRAVIPAERLKGMDLPPVVTSWVAPHAHAVTYYLRRGELFNFVGITENNQWHSESWHEAGQPADLRAAFADWHADLRGVIEAIDQPFRWALCIRNPLPRWVDDRVTLLGDACHPMLPYMAQGAGMAIEDAFVLADCLERMPQAQALQRYQQMRLPRTSRMQATAQNNGRIFHQSGLMRMGLHAGMRAAGMVVPDLVARRFDWIYSHDVTQNGKRSRD